MTVAVSMKDNKSRAVKEAWQAELGYGWPTTGQRRCRSHRPTESTLSVGSDIRFTRRKLSRPCRGCCAALAALLILLLLSAVALYLAHMYLFGDPLNRQTFRGSFIFSEWETGQVHDGGGPRFNNTREEQLRHGLFDLYRNSELRSCFMSADVLALDSVNEGTKVHFELCFEPIFTAVSTDEVIIVLERELQKPAPVYLNVSVVPQTLILEENVMISSDLITEETELVPADLPSTESSRAEVIEIPMECSLMSLSLCTSLSYNTTGYPNIVGHTSKDELEKDLVAFRELFDAECSILAQDFVCQMLQPQCSFGKLIRPCRSYCRAFHAGCGSRLPERLRAHFDCSHFPDYFGPGTCINEPDCPGKLQRLALSRRSCDGVPDCPGAEDERQCSHCATIGSTAVRCARDTQCITKHMQCDGTPDCPDGSDEIGCLWVARSLHSWRQQTTESTLGAVREQNGYAVWAERGKSGKICAASYENNKRALKSVATSLCRSLSFRTALKAEVAYDSESEDSNNSTNHEYVEIVDPFASEISFLKSECTTRKVIKVTCEHLECGIPTARGLRSTAGVQGLSRSAKPGDWPWHAVLLRTHIHACDAALIDPSWLLTTAACFQGQPKAEWTARFGTVRIQSTTPWQQERRIVGMVRSPVEGSMLAMLRLEEPVETTDFVRPICLPEAENAADNQTMCNSLGWTRNRDQLQRIHIIPNPMHTCENASIATVNGICAEPMYDQDDCDEEEFAGSSMMCYDKSTKHWSLKGVSGWRIACTKIGLGRPRIYDSVSSHIDWIHKTIAEAAR